MENLPVRPARTLLAVLAAVLLAPAALWAQEGAIAGLVTDVQSQLGLSAVQVEVRDANDAVVAGALTSGMGAYRIAGVPPGTYAVSFTLPGWEIVTESGVTVRPGETTSLNVQLAERSFNLNPITVTTSKRVEKALDAPAAVEVVTAEDVRERPSLTLTDYVKEKAAVDFVTTGLQGNYVVVRGFNNIFSGQTLTLTDNRIARVPSLRANIAHLNPTTSSDIERVEVVLGPGSALYGPNAANGVIHYLTQSPIDHPGVTLAVSSGLREQDAFSQDVDLITGPATLQQGGTDKSVWHLEGRLATKTNDDKFGVKISGQYFNARDYLFIDDEEARQQSIARVCQSLSYDPTQAACANFSGDLNFQQDPVAAAAALRTRVDNVADGRDSDLERWTLDLRTDWRPTPDWNVILSGGRTTAVHSLDLTGIGAANVIDWGYWYAQGRFNYKRLFGQVFWNKSQNDETFLVRSGRPLVDNSSLFVAQLQHATAINDRHSFTYGVDYLRTDPRSEGTINGRHEDDDSVDEFGGYVQYEGKLSDQFEVVGALRVDNHSRLSDPVVSPRGAIVFRPDNENSIRFTYNRAFSTPTTLNLFLDISAQSIPITGPFFYDARAQGTTENGFSFKRTNGVPDHMSPFAPLVGATPRTFLPTTTEQLWSEAKALVAAGDAQAGALLDAVEGILGPPGSTAVPIVAATLNPETLAFDNPTTDLTSIADVPALDPTIWQTLEVGYKGLLGGKALLAANGYWTHVSDFVSSLRPFTPNVFLEGSSLQQYLVTGFTPLVGVVFPDQATANATAAALAGEMSQIPLGVLAPTTAGGQTAAPLLFTYQNLGSFSFFGADLSLTYVLNEKWELSGSAAWVEKETFDTGTEIVPLNASKWKGAVTLTWRDEDLGLNAAARGRFVDGFPVASGVYVGDVDAYSVFDFNFGWQIPHTRGLSAQLEIQNVFDNDYQSFPGTPKLGRFSVLRLLWHM